MAKKRFVQDMLIPILVLFVAIDLIILGLINPFNYTPIKGYNLNLPAIGPSPDFFTNSNNLPNLPKRTTTTLQAGLMMKPTTSTTTPQRATQPHPKPIPPPPPSTIPPHPGPPPTVPPVPNTTTINLGPAGSITITKKPPHVKVTTPITSIGVP